MLVAPVGHRNYTTIFIPMLDNARRYQGTINQVNRKTHFGHREKLLKMACQIMKNPFKTANKLNQLSTQCMSRYYSVN